MTNSTARKITSFLFAYKVPVLFILLSIGGILVSGQSLNFILMELASRFGRDTLLVLALIIPVVSGMGLNFSIVVGAMAAQIAIFFCDAFIADSYSNLPTGACIFTMCAN